MRVAFSERPWSNECASVPSTSGSKCSLEICRGRPQPRLLGTPLSCVGVHVLRSERKGAVCCDPRRLCGRLCSSDFGYAFASRTQPSYLTPILSLTLVQRPGGGQKHLGALRWSQVLRSRGGPPLASGHAQEARSSSLSRGTAENPSQFAASRSAHAVAMSVSARHGVVAESSIAVSAAAGSVAAVLRSISPATRKAGVEDANIRMGRDGRRRDFEMWTRRCLRACPALAGGHVGSVTVSGLKRHEQRTLWQRESCVICKYSPKGWNELT